MPSKCVECDHLLVVMKWKISIMESRTVMTVIRQLRRQSQEAHGSPNLLFYPLVIYSRTQIEKRNLLRLIPSAKNTT
jgi:hypothetical protein